MPQQNVDVFLRVLNSRRFQSQLRSSAASGRAFAREMESADVATSGLGRAGHTASAGLYAVSAASRAVVFGVGAMAAGIVGFGTQFNATMEGNTLAFEHFAGSAAESKQLVTDLFNIAKNTPFEFTDITTAGRKFLAFGFTVSETKSLLDTLGDTLSITGGGPLEIQRITKAFGDIRAKGRLMQQELNQLTNVGINPYEMLELGGMKLTEKQLKNVGRAGIDGYEAIWALQKGLEETFGGGSEKYLNTFNGQLAKLKDSLKQAAGGSTSGLFGQMKEGLFAINAWIDSGNAGELMDSIMHIGGVVVKILGAAFMFMRDRAMELWNAIQPAAPFFNNVLLPILKGLAVGIGITLVGAWKILIWAVKTSARVLGWIGDKLEPLKPLFYGVGFVLSFFVGWILKAVSWLGKLPGIFGWIGKTLGFLALPIRVVWGAFSALFGFLGKGIAAFNALRTSGWKASELLKIAWTGAMQWIKTAVSKLPGLLLKGGKKAGAALIAGLLGVFSAAGGLAGDIGRGIGDWLNKKTPFGNQVKVGPVSFRIPALAAGGHIVDAGLALVGEKGPEIVSLGRGSTVYPSGTAPAGAAGVAPLRPAQGRRPGKAAGVVPGEGFAGLKVAVDIPITLERREIGRAMGEYTAERIARK